MRCTVPTNVSPSEKILKLYDAGRSGGAGITGRPWPGSLHTMRGAPGSLKHVQPAFISVLGETPPAPAVATMPSARATTATTRGVIRLILVLLPQIAARARSYDSSAIPQNDV